MPKIKTLKFNLKGSAIEININCSSTGTFSASLPRLVEESLHLKSKIVSDSLEALETEINTAVTKYLTAQTKQEKYIFIKYGAKGYFADNSEGNPLFDTSYANRNKYGISGSFNNDENLLSFTFKICIKETVDGKETWYDSRLGEPDHPFYKNEIENEYYKYRSLYSSDIANFQIIPFSEKALSTLSEGLDKLRLLSEMLYTFVSQEPEGLESSLLNQKMLS